MQEETYTTDELETLKTKWEDKLLEASQKDDSWGIEQANEKIAEINTRLE